MFDDLDHALGPVVGLIAIPAPRTQVGGDAAKVFDQSQSQHDRDGPELAQVQRMGWLVRAHEAVQAVLIDATVDMCDQLQRYGVGPCRPAIRN